MAIDTPRSGVQLFSLVKPSGELELSLQRVAVAPPDAHEVTVRIEAAPINPSDLWLMFGTADLSAVKLSGTPDNPVATAPIPVSAMGSMAGRLNTPLAVGNEGAGVVIAAGASTDAQALLGKTVALRGGAMYAQYRNLAADQCLVLPDSATAAEGASSSVNPLTALGMVETMQREGHTALVHTAAASNLGQMLNRICLKDGIGLVNIVRRPEQADLLRAAGAAHVCDSSSDTFGRNLTDALVATGATIAFDATGGGTLAGQILGCMEAALNRTAKEYSRYGSTTHKQVYLYGGLDTRPTEFARNFGMAWGMGGWLLTPFLQQIGNEAAQVLKRRVAAELETTFASHYAGELSLADALRPEWIALYGRRATRSKYLINPNCALT
ncbi:MAG: zinc-binding dehydrogenase [Akkermansiaceae bacterium]|nr:zinc-binding dehydrogenase [Akkermansiaceae bacterium]